ncbi:hypothetical protein [Marinobacter sp. SS8-8]|uniref:hypothetical protein n=1 Tax=Marinobacter sp. SS8-8 TaxID=3050452 RepID=UPI0026E0BB3E|nr:hypothetical protein [Marinobacter sp. SS8-8]|tara:strand:- start:35788 stop:35961 length:174 start_codon:yes stop_codon:yes gene_type:complete
MKELMQKALTAFSHRKGVSDASDERARGRKSSDKGQPEDWGMSPEDALRVGTVARYK